MSLGTPRTTTVTRALPQPQPESRDERRARLIRERDRVIDALAEMDREEGE